VECVVVFTNQQSTLANAFQTDSNGLPLAAWATTDITNDYGVYETEAHTPHYWSIRPKN